MKYIDVFNIINDVAPFSLSEEYCGKYGAYDNSGALWNTGEEIKGILFCLDLTKDAVDEAKNKGANLIVTHHPAIYQKENRPSEKTVYAIGKGISVISAHLNLDVAKDGIDDSLFMACALAAGGRISEVAVMQALNGEGNVGYGKAYGVNGCTLDAFAENLKRELRAKNFSVFGKGNKKIGKVASFCGAGGQEDAVSFALEQGADVIVSSDFKHHVLLSAMENSLAVVAPTHYASEVYGMKKFYEKIRESVDLPCAFFAQDELL